jgi:proteasome assembly chaperone (PAC2) family protein
VEDQVDIHRIIYLKSPSLIVGWHTNDIGSVSFRVLEFLKEKLDAQEIAEIKPLGFFPFGGVLVKRDIVQIYESKFWVCERDNVLLFQSNEPVFEHYKFLNILLDFAERYYDVKELYTINGTVSLIAHTHPRKLFTVFNNPAIKGRLQGYNVEYMTWEGPPAISSYLLWLAGKRGISHSTWQPGRIQRQ